MAEVRLDAFVTAVLLWTAARLLLMPILLTKEPLPFVLGELWDLELSRLGEWGEDGGLVGDSGEPGAGGELLGEPGESGMLSKDDREELLPVLMLIFIDDFVLLRSREAPPVPST